METLGNNAHGINMYYTPAGTSSVYHGTNNTIRTSGDDGYILNFARGGVMTFQDSLLSSTGINAYGMINQSNVNPIT